MAPGIATTSHAAASLARGRQPASYNHDHGDNDRMASVIHRVDVAARHLPPPSGNLPLPPKTNIAYICLPGVELYGRKQKEHVQTCWTPLKLNLKILVLEL